MCMTCKEPKVTTMSSIFEKVRQMLGGGLIYVMTPCGIGCTLNEAYVHYGTHQIFNGYRLEKTPTTINIKLKTKEGQLKTFFKAWKAV